jgi:hypothetical protein
MRVTLVNLTLLIATLSGFASIPSEAQDVRMAPNEVRLSTPIQTRVTSVLPQGGVEFARVTVNVTPGPYGTAVVPTGSTALTNIPNAPVSNFNYPSILLAISATPLRTPEGPNYATDPNSIKNVTGDNDVDWIDITFTVTGLDASHKPPMCNPSPCLKIIGLLPGTTAAFAKPQLADTIAGSSASLASAISPVLPAGGSVLTAATSGIKVLFDSLFPPKTTASQYAYIDYEDGLQKFGWYFAGNSTASPPTSILGIQTGQVMLQADPSIAYIDVKSVALSNWKKKPSSFSDHFLYSTSDTNLPILSNAINYDTLQNLSSFPALISLDMAAKVLHTTSDGVTALIGSQKISATPDGKYVMTSSLGKYIAP